MKKRNKKKTESIGDATTTRGHLVLENLPDRLKTGQKPFFGP